MTEPGMTVDERRSLVVRLMDPTQDPGYNLRSAREAAWSVHWWMIENGYRFVPVDGEPPS